VSEMPKVMLHIVCLLCGSLPFILDDDDDKRSESSLLVLAIRKEKKRRRRNKPLWLDAGKDKRSKGHLLSSSFPLLSDRDTDRGIVGRFCNQTEMAFGESWMGSVERGRSRRQEDGDVDVLSRKEQTTPFCVERRLLFGLVFASRWRKRGSWSGRWLALCERREEGALSCKRDVCGICAIDVSGSTLSNDQRMRGHHHRHPSKGSQQDIIFSPFVHPFILDQKKRKKSR
jgi:hypothetical protein